MKALLRPKHHILLAVATLTFAISATAQAQSLDQYLHLRREYHVHFGASEIALETTVGMRVLEVEANVDGIVQVGDHTDLLVEDSKGGTLNMKANNVPAWLTSNIEARLLVRVYRKDIHSPLQMRLLGAAPEEAIEAVEKKESQQEKLAFNASTARKATWNSASRHQSFGKTYVLQAPQVIVPINQAAPYYARFILKDNPRLSRDKALHIANDIIGFGRSYGVDPRLIMAIVMTESDFNPREYSSAGAMGLGQLMPCNMQDLHLTNAYDTDQNLYGTVVLIRQSLEEYKKKTGHDFNALVLALASYNAGDGAVRKYGGIPPYRETQNYVRRVIRRYYRFCGFKPS